MSRIEAETGLRFCANGKLLAFAPFRAQNGAMRRFRLVLVGLLCCLLSLPGMAFAWAQAPCPAEQPGVAAAIAADADPRCCNDAQVFKETGKPCKTGADGPTPSLFLPSLTATALSPTPTPAFALPAPLAIDTRPPAIWRPPATSTC